MEPKIKSNSNSKAMADSRKRKIEQGLTRTIAGWVPLKFKNEADLKINQLCKTYRDRVEYNK